MLLYSATDVKLSPTTYINIILMSSKIYLILKLCFKQNNNFFGGGNGIQLMIVVVAMAQVMVVVVETVQVMVVVVGTVQVMVVVRMGSSLIQQVAL